MKSAQEFPAGSISLGAYTFDAKTGMLTTGDGRQLFMEHRLRDLFSILLDNRGEFVSKDELRNLAWKKTIVTEQSVPKAISDLRKFFAAHELEGLEIRTVRKLGYRLDVEDRLPDDNHLLQKILPYTVTAAVLLVVFLVLH